MMKQCGRHIKTLLLSIHLVLDEVKKKKLKKKEDDQDFGGDGENNEGGKNASGEQGAKGVFKLFMMGKNNKGD
jgi:hypothetical protein